MVLLVSVLVGLIVVEAASALFGGRWLRCKNAQVIASLHQFHEAKGDDARQQAILRAGKLTLLFSFFVLGMLSVLGGIVFFPLWSLNWNDAQQIHYFAALSVTATVWWLFRVNTRSSLWQAHDNGYGLLDRGVHRLALAPAAVRRLTFDLERQFALPDPMASDDQKGGRPSDHAVYVCGLARSGTTMLLRILDELEDFRSLTYRDMPFVLAPNLWKKITGHEYRETVVKERAHGDGILVNVDSPEGLEEVFWRTFGTRVSSPDCLGFLEPTQAVLETFAEYRAIVANPKTPNESGAGRQKRYLSKNNNNLLRLSSLCADPTATVLLVYRNPFATARSLHRQHQRFCDSQSRDRFMRSYMGWLAHYEFGLDHLPFCFAVAEMSGKYAPDDLDYWLDYWNAVYRYVLTNEALEFHLVNHDNLRAEPAGMLASILATLDVHADCVKLAQQISPQDIVDCNGFSPDLVVRAESTYQALLASSKNIRCSAALDYCCQGNEGHD